MELGAIGTLKEWRKPFKYENALKVCRDWAARRITIKEQTNQIGVLDMQCPKCSTDLVKGKTRKEPDGTEGTEYRCPKCKQRFVDMKIPKETFFGQNII